MSACDSVETSILVAIPGFPGRISDRELWLRCRADSPWPGRPWTFFGFKRRLAKLVRAGHLISFTEATYIGATFTKRTMYMLPRPAWAPKEKP